MQKNIYSVILFLFKFKGKETKKNKLFRDSHIYSKVIPKAREITTTKISYPVGRLRDGLWKECTRKGNVLGMLCNSFLFFYVYIYSFF